MQWDPPGPHDLVIVILAFAAPERFPFGETAVYDKTKTKTEIARIWGKTKKKNARPAQGGGKNR